MLHQASLPTRKSLAVQKWCQFVSTTARSQPHTFLLILSLQASAVEKSTHFRFKAHTEGIIPGIAEQRHCNKDIAIWPFGCCHTCVTLLSHMSLQCTHWCTCRRNSMHGHKLLNKILACPHICLEAFRCSAQTV